MRRKNPKDKKDTDFKVNITKRNKKIEEDEDEILSEDEEMDETSFDKYTKIQISDEWYLEGYALGLCLVTYTPNKKDPTKITRRVLAYPYNLSNALLTYLKYRSYTRGETTFCKFVEEMDAITKEATDRIIEYCKERQRRISNEKFNRVTRDKSTKKTKPIKTIEEKPAPPQQKVQKRRGRPPKK